MPNDRPGNRRPADEAARVATTGSATQATQEAFQNSMQAAADRIQAQGLGPELESAFSQIFDKVFDSILKSFSASSQRVLGGTAAASTGGGGPVTMGGAASHGTYAPSVTSSASYAVGVRNQLAPTTSATGGISGTRTLAGLPVGVPVGQTGTTGIASISGLAPVVSSISRVGYSGGSAIISGAAQMAANAPGMPSYAPTLAPLGSSAATLPATAPPLVPPGLPLTAPPVGAFQGVPAAPATNYSSFQGVPAGTNPSRWQNFRSMVGNRFGGGGGAGGGIMSRMFGGGGIGDMMALAGVQAMTGSINQSQQDIINASMLQTQVRATGQDSYGFLGALTNTYGATTYGYTGPEMIGAAQTALPWMRGAGTSMDVNRFAAFGAGTGAGLGATAQFAGSLARSGMVGPSRFGGMNWASRTGPSVSTMMAAGMGMSSNANPTDWMQGMSDIAEQQRTMNMISTPATTKSLTGYYSAFNAATGLTGAQNAGMMGQINQGVANFQSSRYTTQQMYSALGGNLTPADVGLITSSGAFASSPLLHGQSPFGRIMNYANRQWGSLGAVAESYQLAPMLGISQANTYGLLTAGGPGGSFLRTGNLANNMKRVSHLAQSAGIDLTTEHGQSALSDLGRLAWAGNNKTRLRQVENEMKSQGIDVSSIRGAPTQAGLARLLRGGVTTEADKTREATTNLNRTMEQLDHDLNGFIKTLQNTFGGFGAVATQAIVTGLAASIPSLLAKLVRGGGSSGVGGAIGNFLGSLAGGAGGLIARGAGAVGGAATAVTGVGAAAVAGATAGGLALGGVVGKAVTMGTDEASWIKYGDSIKRFLKSPAGKGFGVTSDLFGGLIVTDGKTTIPVKSWGEVHQRMLGKEKHYVLQTTGDWFHKAQSYDIGAVTTTTAAASAASAAAAIRQHSTRAATAPGGSTTTGVGGGGGGAGPVTAVFDVVNVHIPQNAIAQLVNGQWVFAGTAGVSVTSRDPKHGGSTGSGRPRSNRQGPGPS